MNKIIDYEIIEALKAIMFVLGFAALQAYLYEEPVKRFVPLAAMWLMYLAIGCLMYKVPLLFVVWIVYLLMEATKND